MAWSSSRCRRLPRAAAGGTSAATWRWLGSQGRAWRLRAVGAGLPEELVEGHRQLLLRARALLFPHLPGGDEAARLRGLLAALAGRGSREPGVRDAREGQGEQDGERAPVTPAPRPAAAAPTTPPPAAARSGSRTAAPSPGLRTAAPGASGGGTGKNAGKGKKATRRRKHKGNKDKKDDGGGMAVDETSAPSGLPAEPVPRGAPPAAALPPPAELPAAALPPPAAGVEGDLDLDEEVVSDLDDLGDRWADGAAPARRWCWRCRTSKLEASFSKAQLRKGWSSCKECTGAAAGARGEGRGASRSTEGAAYCGSYDDPFAGAEPAVQAILQEALAESAMRAGAARSSGS